MGLCEFQANLVYIASSRLARQHSAHHHHQKEIYASQLCFDLHFIHLEKPPAGKRRGGSPQIALHCAGLPTRFNSPSIRNCPRSFALQPPSCTQSGESRCATLVSSMIDLIPYEEQGLTRPPTGGRSGEGWGGSRWLWGGQGQVLRPAPCGGLQRHFLNSSNYTALMNPNAGSIGAILWPACILP